MPCARSPQAVGTPLLRVILVAVAIGIVGSLVTVATATERPVPSQVAATEQDVLDQVNRRRQARGSPALRMAPGVQEVAGERSRSMERLGYFAHTSPFGLDAGDLLASRGLGRRAWGEVIGRTRRMGLDPGSRWMVDWWMHSPPHRELLLSRRFEAAGVGVVRERGVTLWTIVLVS
jgi:uncharacterized protein YkwD